MISSMISKLSICHQKISTSCTPTHWSTQSMFNKLTLFHRSLITFMMLSWRKTKSFGSIKRYLALHSSLKCSISSMTSTLKRIKTTKSLHHHLSTFKTSGSKTKLTVNLKDSSLWSHSSWQFVLDLKIELSFQTTLVSFEKLLRRTLDCVYGSLKHSLIKISSKNFSLIALSMIWRGLLKVFWKPQCNRFTLKKENKLRYTLS